MRKYRIAKSNKYHTGSAANYMQKFEHTQEVEAKFAVWKDVQKFSSRSLPTSGSRITVASC